MENDYRVIVGREIETTDGSFGKIVEILEGYGFWAKFPGRQKHVYYPFFGGSLKYWNDEGTDYLPKNGE